MVTASTVSRQAADAFADRVGENRSAIRVADPQWKNLLTQCVVIDVHCSGWPAETRATLDDLGIHPADEQESRAYANVLGLGKLALLPKRIGQQAQAYRAKFRQALYERTIPSHWGRLLPEKRYSDWKYDALQIQGNYENFAHQVYEDWDALIEEQRQHLVTIGLRNYRLLTQAGRKPEMPASEWVAAFVDRVMRKAITREEWLHSMHLTWDDPAYIPLNSMLAEDEAEAARVQAIALAKTEMERDVLKSAQAQFETGLFTFMADARSAVHGLVVEVLDDCLTSIRANKGTLPRNSSKQLKNLVTEVEGLVFWDEPTLTSKMDAIKELLAKPSKQRDGKYFEQVMADLESEARTVLNRLNRPVTGKARRHVTETVEEIDTVSVRKGRKVAQLDDEMVAPAVRQGRKVME